jgi:hypothetical protein
VLCHGVFPAPSIPARSLRPSPRLSLSYKYLRRRH